MAHDITIREDGKAEVLRIKQLLFPVTAEVFVTKVPAWHGLGQVVENAPTAKEAIILAGLDWAVEKVDLYAYHNEKLNLVDGKVGIQRQDNGKVLGVVGVKYQPVQNLEAFELLDSLVDSEELKYESAGSLAGGSTIWLLARLPEVTRITADDILENFLLLKSGHDGLTSTEAMLCKDRVVCRNTLNMAMGRAKNRIRVKHCLNAKDKLVAAREILLGIKESSTNLDSVLKSLSIVGVATDKVTEFLDKMFPLPVVEDKDHPKTKTLNIRNQILTNFEFDEETQTEATKGTAYGLLNSVTKWVDHQRNPKNAHARWESAMFGQGSDLKVEAMIQLRKIVGV